MAVTYLRFFAPQLIPLAGATIYTVPTTPTQTMLKAMRVRLSNTSAAPVSVTLNAVPSGQSVATSNICLPAVAIAPNDYLDVDFPDLSQGDSIFAIAGTNNVVTITQIDGFLNS